VQVAYKLSAWSAIEKPFYLAAVQANQVIVVFALVKFKYGLATFKVAACQDASLFELREHTVHSS
jgi:hypothetical protein